MPTLTINAEVGIHATGADVHLFVDGKRVGKVGPFPNWEDAQRGAETVIAEVRRHALPCVEGVMLDDLRKTEQQ